jgi:hypothetical protein
MLYIAYNNYTSSKTACEDYGKRLVVFEVGGVIDLELSTIADYWQGNIMYHKN